MLWNKKPPARIFISYRRDDSRWVAGRLIDSLRAYFGDDRVFRDIEGIRGGAEFGDVIEHSMDAADAVVVLIGPEWLSMTNENGERRLHDPNDWVAREIAAALVKGVPVYPVLIEGTPMPRADDLPEPLKRLVDRNAVSISDVRWQADVTRLAKIVAIDIPGSVAERTLQPLSVAISLALLAAITITTYIFVGNVLGAIPGSKLWSLEIGPTKIPSDPPKTPADPPKTPADSGRFLESWQSGITYVVIMGSSILMLVYAPLFEVTRRPYAYACGYIGVFGTAVFFLLLWPVEPNTAEPIVMFFGSTVIATAMFATMTLSGFKAK